MSLRKFHIVRTENIKKVAEYIKVCPDSKKDRGLPIRKLQNKNTYCSNFKGSARLFKPEWKSRWKLWEIEEGVFVSNITGLIL